MVSSVYMSKVNDTERTPYLFASVRVYHKSTDVKAVHFKNAHIGTCDHLPELSIFLLT